MEWFTRMKEALDLMELKMEERLDIEEIAKAAYSSPFHFQRMFHMLTGMTVAEYTRKRKLTLAAQELAMSSSKVLDIALKYGYDSPESFAKAFRKVHGISPSEARSPGVSLKAFPRISFHLSLKGDKDMDYRIVEQEAFKVVGRAFRTTCQNNDNTREIPTFWGACHQDGTIDKLVSIGEDNNLLGIVLDMQPGSEDFTYMIASQSNVDEAALAEGFTTAVVPAYTWAIFTSVGPMPGAIQDTICRIFQEWFPATGYEHSGGPEIEVYPPGDTTAEDYRCEVWVPIVKK
ncbi:effector binding domain-containing protein [Paenibacillus oenotherae]|uniref:Effector binding domain-containing protein n=1 Tax=Paenibacillus oenotherae TaxID=1435645 RepID=A0ABS7D783_9BACL|nr:effector binding domain-containing protein [Paenibacillus oenotherae]MBW7475802.1 effector binding domain-containing protein [Paenibacillus oenotherae]